MEKDVTISARISKKLAKDIEFIAKQSQRSKSWLVENALRHYAMSEMEFIEAVEEGKRDVAAGRVYTHEQVFADLKKRRKKPS